MVPTLLTRRPPVIPVYLLVVLSLLVLRNAGESQPGILLKTEAPAGDVSCSEEDRWLAACQRRLSESLRTEEEDQSLIFASCLMITTCKYVRVHPSPRRAAGRTDLLSEAPSRSD
ncbi:hypothetical protein SRHO_G00175490 [Serrasalmus rhombeus]